MNDVTEIDPARLPRHVAIIMDGNGRWAERRGQPRLFGHRAGAESVREVVEAARELGIEVLTLYAFSNENWSRPEQEVSGLMAILKKYLLSELQRMLENGIRLRCLGDIDRLPAGVREIMDKTMGITATNRDFTLNLALSYGARDEIVRAARLLASDCMSGKLSPAAIGHGHFSDKLYTTGQPDPDLLIRTGGEERVSNFLLWQISYSEIFFSPVMWPEFRRPQFLQAIVDYQHRERRFGKTGAQLREG
ncbi:MAG: isoprenyl transferase [Desulfobulbaceae bacterium]|jgi:undecaprenyl diphosphate synthase|nr:isoprenyl transferase [Desulfobulbaceae bacterium]